MSQENPARLADNSPEAPDVDPEVHAVGIGPGNEAFVSPRVRRLLADADVVIGFATVTDRIESMTEGEILRCSYDDQTDVLEEFGARVADGARGVAVLWGDPNVSGYQFLGRVEAAVNSPVQVVPGVSSVQVAASRSRTPLEHSAFASFHRRGDVGGDIDRLAEALHRGRHAIAIVRPYDWMPPDIANGLLERGVDPERTALVLQELTLPGESIEPTTLGALAAVDDDPEELYSDLTILTVRTPEP